MKRVMQSKIMIIVAVAIVLSGTFVYPVKGNEVAAVAMSGEDKVYYEPKTGQDFQDLYVTQNKKAPVKEGYLFGGWYRDEGATVITAQTAGDVSNNDTVYAKFVPAYVLSVKAQNYSTTKASESGTPSEENKTTTRVVSTIDDSLNYSEVGFKLLVNGKEIQKNTTKVWETLQADGEPYGPTKAFGNVSKYFFVLNINKIPETKWTDQIYARPYWITEDGTEVEGLGKYVYVEDGIKNYISVPVNLNDVTEGIAAGILQVDYDETKLRYVECVNGRIFKEMAAADRDSNGNKYVKCVGNVDEISDVIKDEMYITLRFEVTADETLTSRTVPYQFVISDEDFVNIEEEDVTLKVWNVQY